jgi:hypothetical protein
MRYTIATLIAVAGFAVAGNAYGVSQFRGQITAIQKDAGTVSITYFGNPEINQGMALYVHDAYGKTKGRLTLMTAAGSVVSASVDEGMDELACGNYVASFEASDADSAQYFGRYEFNVKIRYERQPRFYDVMVDRVFEFDRYLRFVWEDGKAYRIDINSIDELVMSVVGDDLVLNGILLKDEVDTAADRFVSVSQMAEDMMPWQKTIIEELRGLEVLVENQFLFTYRDIKAVEVGDVGAGIPTQMFIKDMAIADDAIRTATEDSIGQLNTGTLQTEEVITVYPVIFRFDQYRRVIVALQESINLEIRQPTPDLEEIARLRQTLDQLEQTLTMQDIVSVKVVIKDANEPTRNLSEPVTLTNRGDSWQAKVNLTRGQYRYYFQLEVRAQPCNLSFEIQDPLNASGVFEVLSRVIPIQVNDMGGHNAAAATSGSTPANTAVRTITAN